MTKSQLEFELHFHDLNLMRMGDGSYHNYVTGRLWESWQASRISGCKNTPIVQCLSEEAIEDIYEISTGQKMQPLEKPILLSFAHRLWRISNTVKSV